MPPAPAAAAPPVDEPPFVEPPLLEPPLFEPLVALLPAALVEPPAPPLGLLLPAMLELPAELELLPACALPPWDAPDTLLELPATLPPPSALSLEHASGALTSPVRQTNAASLFMRSAMVAG